MTNKGKTWSCGTNSRLPFAVNMKLTGLKCSYGKISSPLTEISVGKTEISLTEPATPSFERIKNFTKDIEDEISGNRASPVNRAHMKRPTLSFSTSKDYYVEVLCIDPATEKLTFYGTKSSESTELAKHPSGRAGFHR